MMRGSTMALHSLMSLALLFLSVIGDPDQKDKIVWTARIKRQATDDSGNSNNNQSQPMIFNHVYNINVPLESLCTVDLDSKGSIESDQSGEEYKEQSMDSDSQVTFTHSINIPKAVCSCPASAMLQELASRIEMLEREVSLLKVQCSSACCGDNLVLGESKMQVCLIYFLNTFFILGHVQTFFLERNGNLGTDVNLNFIPFNKK